MLRILIPKSYFPAPGGAVVLNKIKNYSTKIILDILHPTVKVGQKGNLGSLLAERNWLDVGVI